MAICNIHQIREEEAIEGSIYPDVEYKINFPKTGLLTQYNTSASNNVNESSQIHI